MVLASLLCLEEHLELFLQSNYLVVNEHHVLLGPNDALDLHLGQQGSFRLDCDWHNPTSLEHSI